jgi:hypothetical protein
MHGQFVRVGVAPPNKSLKLLETADEALALAKELIRTGALPAKAADDALHIAVAAMNGIPYLLTWNCHHLANATMRPLIEEVCEVKEVKAPITCTPEELLGAQSRTIPSWMRFGAFATPTRRCSITTWTRYSKALKSKRKRAA